MPIGVIVNSSSLIIGGITGVLLSKFIPKRLIDNLPSIFGLGAILIALTLMVEVENITFAMLAIILGAIIGELLNIGNRIEGSISNLLLSSPEESYKVSVLLTVIMLFCFSGTGIFGALNEGFTGDSSILLAKSVLDFFTALIFGASIGKVVTFVAIPQFILNTCLFYLAAFIMPLMSSSDIANFKAVGGVVALAAALKLLDLIKIDILNLIPSIGLALIACMLN